LHFNRETRWSHIWPEVRFQRASASGSATKTKRNGKGTHRS
jgi:hypothetical protein